VKLTIAVSGLNNIDSPGPGVPVIRAIRESKDLDVRIIGLAYENLEPGAYMPNVADKTYKVPYPSEGSDALLARIRYIHEQEKLEPTQHEKILLARHRQVDWDELTKVLDEIEAACAAFDTPRLLELLTGLVPENRIERPVSAAS